MSAWTGPCDRFFVRCTMAGSSGWYFDIRQLSAPVKPAILGRPGLLCLKLRWPFGFPGCHGAWAARPVRLPLSEAWPCSNSLVAGRPARPVMTFSRLERRPRLVRPCQFFAYPCQRAQPIEGPRSIATAQKLTPTPGWNYCTSVSGCPVAIGQRPIPLHCSPWPPKSTDWHT
jgi:hypothetical protein